jgi:hypothetical protein
VDEREHLQRLAWDKRDTTGTVDLWLIGWKDASFQREVLEATPVPLKAARATLLDASKAIAEDEDFLDAVRDLAFAQSQGTGWKAAVKTEVPEYNLFVMANGVPKKFRSKQPRKLQQQQLRVYDGWVEGESKSTIDIIVTPVQSMASKLAMRDAMEAGKRGLSLATVHEQEGREYSLSQEYGSQGREESMASARSAPGHSQSQAESKKGSQAESKKVEEPAPATTAKPKRQEVKEHSDGQSRSQSRARTEPATPVQETPPNPNAGDTEEHKPMEEDYYDNSNDAESGVV